MKVAIEMPSKWVSLQFALIFIRLVYQKCLLCVSVCIVFEESDISYWFMANSAKDQDEWSTALSSGRYVRL